MRTPARVAVVLFVLLALVVLLAGCSGFTAELTGGQGVLEGRAVDEVPPDATVAPYDDLVGVHPSVRTVVREAAATDGDLAQVWVDRTNVTRVKSDLADLPHYAAPPDSEYDYGYYVRYRDATVVVRLTIED